MEKSIFEYKNLNDFLEGFRHLKPSQRKLSFTELSKKLNYSSDRTVGMVYKGLRPLSTEMQRRIAKHLNLSPKEIIYLETLSQIDRLKKKGTDTKDLEKKLFELRPKKSNYIVLTSDELELLTKWYYFPIKNILSLHKDGIEAQKISKLLEGKISAQEIESAMSVLVKLGFATQIEAKYFPVVKQEKYLTTKFDVPSKSLQTAHREMLARAADALSEQSVLDREYISKTLVVSADKIELYKKRIREFCEELSEDLIAKSDDTNKLVYQLSLQFFRQANIKK